MPPAQRAGNLDWKRIAAELEADGVARTGQLLTAEECIALRALYDLEEGFRSRIVMKRHGFGSGEYKYFSYPLPALIDGLRHAIYPYLVPIANEWHRRMALSTGFPHELDPFLAQCHDAGQTRPTPLLLKYEAGDYNCLHQDLYGAQVFPIQLVLLLSDPKSEFSGGEFAVTEQRPRMQSRLQVASLQMGEGALFAVHDRPKRGTRGDYRVRMRHGVSRVASGTRFAAGVIFHDAQ